GCGDGDSADGINSPSASSACPYTTGKKRAPTDALAVAGTALRSGGIWLYHRCHLSPFNGERCQFSIAYRTFVDSGWRIRGAGMLWLVVGCQALGRSALPERKPVGTRDLCVANTCQRFSHLIDFKQYWLWWHVYGHHIAGHDSGSSVECARQD